MIFLNFKRSVKLDHVIKFEFLPQQNFNRSRSNFGTKMNKSLKDFKSYVYINEVN